MTILVLRISVWCSRTTLARMLDVALTLVPLVASTPSTALADASMVRQLESRATISWRGQTLGAAVDRLADVQRMPLWVDRRVDTSAIVDLSVDDEPVGAVLARLGESANLAAVPFRTIVYFGPRRTADELATLSIRARESLANAPAGVRAKWLQATAWSFLELSQPRALVDGLARSVGASVSGEERVPLDLWPARTLPALSTLDRVVLILAGFDLTAEISPDGRTLRVAPIVRPVELSREYAVPRQRRAAFEAVLAELPSDKVEPRKTRTKVAARWEDHERLRAAIRNESGDGTLLRAGVKPRGGGRKSQTFTLKIAKQPVDRVIEQIAVKTGLTVEWSSPPPQGPAGLTDCDVHDASLDELLEAILTPVGLAAKRDGEKLAIVAAQ